MKTKILFLVFLLFATALAAGNQQQNQNQNYLSDIACDATITCSDNMECASFPNVGLRCYQGDACELAECASDEECVIAETYPVQVMCQKKNQQQQGQTDTVEYDVATGKETVIKKKIKSKVQNQIQQMTQQIEGFEGVKAEVYHAKNQVRETVHYFLAFPEEITEKNLGQQIKQVANQFNNSVQAQINAEERVRNRQGIMKFLFGADENAVAELEQEQEQLQTQMQEMEQLKEQLSDDEQEFVENQLQVIEQEQDRIKELVGKEKKNKGIFGWIFK